MRRRDFITGLGGVAAMPLVGRAQQQAIPVIGVLSSRSSAESAPVIAGFHRGLREAGFVEGQNITIEYRWAEGRDDRLPALVADLVRRKVDVIATVGGLPPALAAKKATSKVPIVFISSDPVKFGLVQSVNRPGGNATGVDVLLQEMEGKRLGLLRELIPNAQTIGVLLNPSSPSSTDQLADVEDTARRLGQKIQILRAANQQQIDSAFVSLATSKPGALLVTGSPLFNSRREQIVTLANHYKLPAIYEVREYAIAGGLMSYGTNLPDAYRQVGLYTGRILKGENPGELPVYRMTKFEFVINLKTARALGIEVPGVISARADEIIE